MDIAELRLQCLKMAGAESQALDTDSLIEAARKLEAYLLELPGSRPSRPPGDYTAARPKPAPGGTSGGWTV